MRIVENKEQRQVAFELEHIAKELVKAKKVFGIPSPKRYATSIRGYTIADVDGISITVGYDWEKASYNKQRIRTLSSGKKHYIPETYSWVFPSVVILHKDYAGSMTKTISESRREEVDSWMRTLIKIGEDLGLKVRGTRSDSEVEMILKN